MAAVLALPASASAVGTVSGNVTDTASTALEGICVEVRDDLGGPALASTETAANGDYTVPDVPAGSHKVQFHDCNGGDYVQEFFNDKTDFAQADPVNVADGQDTPDIDAALQPAGHISGHVEDASTSTSIEGICVSASTDPSGFGPPAGNAQTDASGNYDMGGLPAGSYKVTFVDCPQPPADTGGDYVQQWFDGKSSAALADSVNVTVNNTTTGVDASLQPAGHITGNVQDDVTHADLEGICVQAVDAA
ncbi:MAG TPA: carboxypeptidase-like regulatory domain-containing protein, partial [Solirubrobacteraceae bacterium]|nr:carboxypeptidase-like regulatory domain-containing protein [Solirubrobacteraceae bacterium]